MTSIQMGFIFSRQSFLLFSAQRQLGRFEIIQTLRAVYVALAFFSIELVG